MSIAYIYFNTFNGKLQFKLYFVSAAFTETRGSSGQRYSVRHFVSDYLSDLMHSCFNNFVKYRH